MCKTSYRLRSFFLCSLLVPAAGLWAVDERFSGPSEDETITIEAREAWEDEDPEIVHFRGNFKLATTQWSVFADQATLYGKLDDPETVRFTGSPVAIVISSRFKDEERIISGEADHIVYQKSTNSIQMTGAATLNSDDSTLLGNKIEYLIDSDRINAGGEKGIRILIDTTEQP